MNPQMDRPQPPTPPNRRYDGKHILVVDDEVDILEGLRDVLEVEMPGAVVVPAENAARAFQIMQSIKVDAIVSDFRMPGINGLEFLTQARESTSGIPLILITAYPAAGLAMRAINEAHVTAMFAKPFDGTRLVAHLKTALAETGSAS